MQPRLSAPLAALFPPGVVAVELTSSVSADSLTPQERDVVRKSAPKRVLDFAAGRACARMALAELGIHDFSLLPGPHREPLWPPGMVGSITHTKGYTAAVVARGRELSSIGIDCEEISAVNEEVWRGICTPRELERIGGLEAAESQARAALVFAAKEAFYKLQYPLTGAWVGFEDVEIGVGDGNTFNIIPQRELPLRAERLARVKGRYRFFERWVVAAAAIGA